MSNRNPFRPGLVPAAAAVLCLLPALAWGQTRWGNTPIFGSIVDIDAPAGYAVGDLDGDGRPDLVAAGANWPDCRLLVLLQDASGHYPAVSSEPLGVGLGLCDGHEALAMGDLDGDGDLDVVAQGKDSTGAPRLLWFAGDGAGHLVPQPDIRTPGLWDGAVALGDLDGDGDLDLLATGQDGGSGCGVPCHWPGFRALVFRNDGHGAWTLAQQPLGVDRGLAFGSSLAIGDVDSDGDLDAVASGETTDQNRALVLLRNDGTGALAPDSGAIPPPGLGNGLDAGWLRLADLDLDGDLDLVAAGDLCCLAGSPPTRQDLLAFPNVGGTFGIPQTVLRLVAGSQFCGLALGDVDGNGFPDLLADTHEAGQNKIRYLANVGGVLLQEQVITPTAMGPILLADFDGDLDLDVVVLPVRDLYENLLGPANAAPTAPAGLGNMVSAAGLVDLAWAAATDPETGSPALAYEVRLGSAPGVHDRFTGVFPPSLGTAPSGASVPSRAAASTCPRATGTGRCGRSTAGCAPGRGAARRTSSWPAPRTRTTAAPARCARRWPWPTATAAPRAWPSTPPCAVRRSHSRLRSSCGRTGPRSTPTSMATARLTWALLGRA